MVNILCKIFNTSRIAVIKALAFDYISTVSFFSCFSSIKVMNNPERQSGFELRHAVSLIDGKTISSGRVDGNFFEDHPTQNEFSIKRKALCIDKWKLTLK